MTVDEDALETARDVHEDRRRLVDDAETAEYADLESGCETLVGIGYNTDK